MNFNMFTVTLFEPQIPPNTGNIARLCAATNIPLHIVGQIGFKLTNRYLKRAGLDYWQYLDWQYFDNTEDYIAKLQSNGFHLFTTKSSNSYTDRKYQKGNYLIFGSETKGIAQKFLDRFSDRCCTIPMMNPKVRSLNLSSTVAIALYEAIRQINNRKQPSEDKVIRHVNSNTSL